MRLGASLTISGHPSHIRTYKRGELTPPPPPLHSVISCFVRNRDALFVLLYFLETSNLKILSILGFSFRFSFAVSNTHCYRIRDRRGVLLNSKTILNKQKFRPKMYIMYQSIPSLTISPGDARGFAHSSCPWGRVFAPLSCPGVLNQNENAIILKKSTNFALLFKQRSSSTFDMLIYARSQQCDLIGGPTYLLII